MKLEINLITDFENAILTEIAKLKENDFLFLDYNEWKAQTDNTNGSESEYLKYLVYSFLNLKQRLIVAKPRKILYAKNFVRKSEYESGLQQLEKEITTGICLFPRLSRKIFNPNFQDGMLFDFGIYHLHLGVEPDKKYPQLVKGGKEVLYCLFDDEFAYFLVIDEHNKWANLDFLKIIKDSFPQKLDTWEMKGQFANPPINEQERIHFRKNGINTPIELDGKFYLPMGGGISMNGFSFEAIRAFQKQKRRLLIYIENTIKEHFNNNVELEQKLNISSLNLSLQSLQPFVLIDEEHKIFTELEFDNDRINKISIYKE